MSDPLSLLRQATIARQPVVSENGNYVFGSIKLPEKTSTCFRRTLKENDYCYTLKDIVLFLANADFGDVEYRRKVIQEGAGVTAIVRNDREALTNYLTGIIDSCPQIDFQLAASYQLPVQNDTILATEQHTMSLEKMQQQRERYIAQMEKTLQKTKSGESSNNDNLKSLKHLKRSSAQAFGGDGEDDAIDRQFLDADLKILESLRSDEIPAQTRSTVLNASSTDFSVVLKLFTEKILKPMQAPSKSASASASAHNMQARKPVPTTTAIATTSTTNPSSNNSTNIRPSGLTGGRNYPIIIVPNAPTSNITLLNIEEFLGQGIYHTVEEKRKSGMKTSRTVLITRKLSNEKTIIYRVIDDPKHLNDAEWNLVVAVFATGQTWQFKNWKYSTPVSLFENVLGVHVGIDSANVDMNIQSWNCKVLKVNLFKQHINAGAAKEFWMYLDDYMKLRRARPVLPTTNTVPTAVVSQPPHAPLPPSAAAYKQHHHHTAPAPTASSAMRSVPPPPPPPSVPVSAARPLPPVPVQPAPPTSAAAGVVPPPPPPPQFRPPSSSTHAIK